MLCTPEWIEQRLAGAGRLWLFLDYDGTLADFAPTPDDVSPDPELIAFLARLVRCPHIDVGIISGRRLSQVRALLPVPGMLLAGTYGVEIQTQQGELLNRVGYDVIRPTLDLLKPRWRSLIEGHNGFFLEDKGWSLALHGRFAKAGTAEQVLSEARRAALRLASTERFRMLGGHRFLEIAPGLAHKGRTVEYVLDCLTAPGAVPLYLGDDDKDEEAFEVVKGRGGITILVASEPRETRADCRLPSPLAARQWLRTLLRRLEGRM